MRQRDQIRAAEEEYSRGKTNAIANEREDSVENKFERVRRTRGVGKPKSGSYLNIQHSQQLSSGASLAESVKAPSEPRPFTELRGSLQVRSQMSEVGISEWS